jgi:predicted phosphohydrolase
MRIQFISDLHEKFPYIIPQAEYIAVLGDVANPFDDRYYTYLSYLSQMFKGVFVIFGNHEYYHNTIPDVEKYMENMCKHFNNVYFLNNKSIIVDGYLIVGSTLWSAVEQNAFEYLNCGNLIKMNKRKYMDFMDYRVLHLQCVEFIQKELDKGLPTIILTHYAPLHEMNGHRQTKLNSGFSTDLSCLIKKNKKNIKAWLSGHTHKCITMMKEGVLFSSNCLGHLNESYEFNVNKCIEV